MGGPATLPITSLFATAETRSGPQQTAVTSHAGASERFAESPFQTRPRRDVDGTIVVPEVVREFLDRRSGKTPPAISTGLKSLDSAIVGLRPGKMFVVAGRPGMGKTAFADNTRRSVIAQGHVVLQFSLEMSADEIAEREISWRAQVGLMKVSDGRRASDAEAARVAEVAQNPGTPGLWKIYDTCFQMDDIAEAARLEKAVADAAGLKIGLVIIDYLQLIGGGSNDNRQMAVSGFSRTSKLLAKELGCSVMALSQLNRSCEYRDDKRPLMADLRESGAIEQDADIIMFVYRHCQYDPMADRSEAELIIRKQRGGPTGTVHLVFNQTTVTFHDMEAK